MVSSLVVATHNPGKFKEIREILSDLPLKVESLDEYPAIGEIEESGKTFEENALIKARWVSRLLENKIVLADDSGLVIPFLEGRPGVFSARYAGEKVTYAENNEKVLKELDGVPEEKRNAFFICVMVLLFPDGKTKIVEGRCDGFITKTPKGKGGFGYDPIFWIPSVKRTLAELPPLEKNRLSHRGVALQNIKLLFNKNV
ncbi:MAG: XTP/dITP diphosphatase [bacterium]|nr:XTP/dITP diphosphatase [bacterium]